MQLQKSSLRNLYAYLLSLIGLGLVISGLIRLPTYNNLLILVLFMALSVLAQLTSTAMKGGSRIEVASAVSIAAVALYGPFGAVLVAASGAIVVSYVSLSKNWPGLKSTLERFGVNIGMLSISAFITGLVFYAIQAALGADTLSGILLSWLMAAIVHDQVNLWLLIGMIHLQHGVNPLEIWRGHQWAIPIDVLVMSVGGGALAFAANQLGVIGVVIFSLPIISSAYSFRVYVNETKKQMENLEDLVEQRTSDLAFANDELATLNEDLSTLSKEKDSFLSVLTHDMRTPLTSIKGFASILHDREMPREKQVHIAEVILRNQDSLLELVNNILEIEKLQSGTPVLLERSNVDLADLTKHVTETILATAVAKNIELNYIAHEEPIIVSADQPKIQRVMQNLISNAIKYTPEGGKVDVDLMVQDDYAVFKVKDTGYGIPEDELPFIFDRYSRVKGHKHLAVGTGLGLAIVKSLIEAHRGKITAESEVGTGSVFTMKLPF